VSAPDVNIGYGVFGDGVTVTFTHEIPTPGIFKYLGIDVDTTIKSSAYTYAVNPTSFARTVNLASDLADFVMKKLGMEGKWGEIKSKLEKVVQKLF